MPSVHLWKNSQAEAVPSEGCMKTIPWNITSQSKAPSNERRCNHSDLATVAMQSSVFLYETSCFRLQTW